MKEKILILIKERNEKISFKELKNKLEIDTITLENLLLELKLDGKVLQVGNKYSLFPDGILIGDVSTTLSGNKVIFYNDEKIPIATNFFDAILLNDVVAFRINEHHEAEVVSVIDRRIKNITCEVVIEDGVKKVIPYHKGIKVNLDKNDMKELLDGDIILVDIDINNDDEYCNAILVKKLAIKDSPNRKEIEIAINYGFDNDYSDEYMDELSKIPKNTLGEDLSNRTDYRNMVAFTIDGANTKDMDDGCSVEELSNGMIRVYVHISDVSHYVKSNSILFKRACEKTTSLYLNNSVFHMFHHILSNGICSLNQGEDRLTKTVIMDIDNEGYIHNTEIVKSIINSNKKMTYDDVDLVLEGKEIPEGYMEYVNDINLLNMAAIRVRKRMEENGSISFASNELEKKYDNDGKLISYHFMGESPARKLIEYLMIATNEEVAKYLLYSPLPAVYRIHEYPELKRVNEAIKAINELGKRIRPLRELDNPIALQKIQKMLQDDEDYQILSTILLKFMKRARYSVENMGHFALSLDAYTHFTSPIRRLPDLLVHMILDVLIQYPELIEAINGDELEQMLRELCDHASMMSRQADIAERDAEKASIIECMYKDIGKEFDGVVLDIGNQLKIRMNSIDVMIQPDSLGENFKYNKKKKLYYDMDNDIYLKLGAKVVVLLEDIVKSTNNIKIKVLGIVNPKTLVKTKQTEE